ncbi:hypothetical protein SAMN05444365_101557 [Micromonospora pattaloongensis]|uniref:Peptidase MA superfamily n=1 Tax=Micromonospora pattaloongensis TaxID=405436 RepID=A0A1H3GTI1_9ACTN|nr:hypothetical protein [Micromonospora pattaloongensis]SDY06632.1 hypothetical protein SAMN05444365_101557 [Micromonospora pattaloongensis]
MTDPGSDRPSGRRWPLWLGLGLALTLLACVLPVGLAAKYVDRLPDAAGAAARSTPPPARSPRPGDPTPVAQAWLRERIAELLQQQAAALLRGDERGFVAVADPASPAAGALKRQFRALRALRVTAWQPRVDTVPIRVAGGVEWRVRVSYQHCFVVASCRTGPVVMESRWRDAAGRLRMVAVESSLSAREGPRPWAVSDLVVAVGRRALVATTPAHRKLLPGLLAEAEAAAVVADRYAVGEARPDRYRVFYAGAAEWRRWYGGGRPSWTAGYAVAVGGGHYEVVLNGGRLHSTVLGDLLRHELTHAASLPDQGYRDGGNWWLVEGMAELAGAGGRPVRQYDGLPELRRLLQSDAWNGRLETAEAAAAADDWDVTARYAIGYLAVRHLVDRFGERQLLAFFAAVVHDGATPEAAARQVFGEEWPTLQDDCVAYLRAAAG